MKYQLSMHLCRVPDDTYIGTTGSPEVFHTESINFESHDDLKAKQTVAMLRASVPPLLQYILDEGKEES